MPMTRDRYITVFTVPTDRLIWRVRASLSNIGWTGFEFCAAEWQNPKILLGLQYQVSRPICTLYVRVYGVSLNFVHTSICFTIVSKFRTTLNFPVANTRNKDFSGANTGKKLLLWQIQETRTFLWQIQDTRIFLWQIIETRIFLWQVQETSSVTNTGKQGTKKLVPPLITMSMRRVFHFKLTKTSLLIT